MIFITHRMFDIILGEFHIVDRPSGSQGQIRQNKGQHLVHRITDHAEDSTQSSDNSKTNILKAPHPGI